MDEILHNNFLNAREFVNFVNSINSEKATSGSFGVRNVVSISSYIVLGIILMASFLVSIDCSEKLLNFVERQLSIKVLFR